MKNAPTNKWYVEEEINFLNYWNTIWKNRKTIVTVIICSTIITSVVLYNSSKTYLAQASLLSMDTQPGSLSSALGNLPFPTIGGKIASSADKLKIILKSRTIAQRVVEQLNIIKFIEEEKKNEFSFSNIIPKSISNIWKTKSNKTINLKPQKLDNAVGYLKKRTTINDTKEGLLNIYVEWVEPEIGAEIVNAYISVLSEFVNDHSMNITFQIIDPAQTPTSKHKPKTLLSLILSFFISLSGSVFFIFIKENISEKLFN